MKCEMEASWAAADAHERGEGEKTREKREKNDVSPFSTLSLFYIPALFYTHMCLLREERRAGEARGGGRLFDVRSRTTPASKSFALLESTQ